MLTAEAALRKLGVRNPVAYVRLLAPGFQRI